MWETIDRIFGDKVRLIPVERTESFLPRAVSGTLKFASLSKLLLYFLSEIDKIFYLPTYTLSPLIFFLASFSLCYQVLSATNPRSQFPKRIHLKMKITQSSKSVDVISDQYS